MEYKSYQVYIITNKNNTVLYTGITNDLIRRLEEHQSAINKKSFTARYNVNKLVWFENYYDPMEAIVREKQIKAGSRKKKILLIEQLNPNWDNLSDTLH